MALVDQLMNITFAQRRNCIIGSQQSVIDITNKFLFLEFPKEVSFVECIQIILL